MWFNQDDEFLNLVISDFSMEKLFQFRNCNIFIWPHFVYQCSLPAPWTISLHPRPTKALLQSKLQQGLLVHNWKFSIEEGRELAVRMLNRCNISTGRLPSKLAFLLYPNRKVLVWNFPLPWLTWRRLGQHSHQPIRLYLWKWWQWKLHLTSGWAGQGSCIWQRIATQHFWEPFALGELSSISVKMEFLYP